MKAVSLQITSGLICTASLYFVQKYFSFHFLTLIFSLIHKTFHSCFCFLWFLFFHNHLRLFFTNYNCMSLSDVDLVNVVKKFFFLVLTNAFNFGQLLFITNKRTLFYSRKYVRLIIKALCCYKFLFKIHTLQKAIRKRLRLTIHLLIPRRCISCRIVFSFARKVFKNLFK